MLFQNKNMKLMIEQINLFLTYLLGYTLMMVCERLQLSFSWEQRSISKSIKKASIFNKNYKDKNEQHFQILKVLFLCGILGGLYFNTRLN